VYKKIPVATNCNFPLKKLTTILLLASFLVFQYARQVSYWECRLSNSFKISNEKCDCEQMINQVSDQSEPLPFPAHHNHFHVDETFFPACTLTIKKSFDTQQSSTGMMLQVFINKIIASRLDRPPQMQ
jgi:hypothetical protein